MNHRRRFLTLLALVPLASIGIYGGACGHSHDVDFEVDHVVYDGEANDEALLALLANKATATDTKGAVFDAPAAGASLPAATTAKFRWHVAAATSAVDPAERSQPQRAGRPLQRMAQAWDLFGPMRAAHAHGDPVNGEAHFLVFSAASKPILGVFTTNLEYTPSIDDWALLAGAAQPIEVTVLSGVFAEGALTAEGGPFLGETLSFSITK
ncbi:MAG: hypothetical protein QM820_65005 [Minicystis sp.]